VTSAPRPLRTDEWPPDYVSVWAWRQKMLRRYREEEGLFASALKFYEQNPTAFICHWMDTYDPRKAGRGRVARMPFIMFERQAELVDFLYQLLESEDDGLIEKCRDMGATWIACAVSVHLWRFWDGASVGWGSRKEQLVDKIGDPDSIFEKIRILIKNLPPMFLPEGFQPQQHISYMKILNPETGATITGEAGNNIGRGGRKLIYFKDESAHYERPELIEAALGDNTRVQVDISSVNGIGNVFHRRRESGVEWGGEVTPGRTNVFVMDWRHHPEKDEEWYERRRKKAEADGLLHLFAQEVDRDYSASVEGVIIPSEWVSAAVDAHITLGLPPAEGRRIGGLDVGDGGGDSNALALRRSYMVLGMHHRPMSDDTGVTTRWAAGLCRDEATELQYDCVGIGAGVKSEANRLRDTGQIPEGLNFVPWSAGARVLHPDRHVIPRDRASPLNKDFYANLKAQAWWQLRLRFERTWRAVREGVDYRPEDLISIPRDLPNRLQLMKELSQATASQSAGTLKMIVDKAPDGARSPNCADAVVMAYWPQSVSNYNLMALAS
jgi:phage terminase large subunit